MRSFVACWHGGHDNHLSAYACDSQQVRQARVEQLCVDYGGQSSSTPPSLSEVMCQACVSCALLQCAGCLSIACFVEAHLSAAPLEFAAVRQLNACFVLQLHVRTDHAGSLIAA